MLQRLEVTPADCADQLNDQRVVSMQPDQGKGPPSGDRGCGDHTFATLRLTCPRGTAAPRDSRASTDAVVPTRSCARLSLFREKCGTPRALTLAPVGGTGKR